VSGGKTTIGITRREKYAERGEAKRDNDIAFDEERTKGYSGPPKGQIESPKFSHSDQPRGSPTLTVKDWGGRDKLILKGKKDNR